MGLYDADFHAWAEQQADAIRRRSVNEIDWENLQEEVESLGKSERSQLDSRLTTLLVHLLKWEHQPARRGRSWALTIIEQRGKLAKHLKQNPSLRPLAGEVALDAYPVARVRAARETRLPLASFPEAAPYTVEQMLEDRWLPGSEMPDDL